MGEEPWMSTSMKHIARKFISEPMGDKEVTTVAGIRPAYGERLNEKGFDRTYILFGQFLLLRKDQELSMDWLKEEVGAGAQHARSAFKCLAEWAEHHI